MVDRGEDESLRGGDKSGQASATVFGATARPGLSFDPATVSSIADALPVMVAYCDAGQIYRFCNQPICDWFERPRDEIIGHTVREIMGEKAYDGRQEAIAAALTGEKQWFAARFDHPTRGALTTQAEYTPHIGPDGTVLGVIMVVQDLTEQRAAEVALRESEARFRRIANSAPAPMWVTRVDGSRDFVNEAFIEFFGFDEKDVAEKDWQRAVHPDDREALIAEYASGIKSGESFEATGRLRRADGEWRWMRSLSHPRRNAEGETIGFIGIANDVTLAKEAELELRRLVDERTAELSASEARFRAIFDTVMTIIVLMDPSGTVIDVNRSSAPWRATNHRDAIGGKIWDSPTLMLYPGMRETMRDLVVRAAAGDAVDEELSFDGGGKNFATLTIAMRPLRNSEGGLEYLMLEARDTTELKLAQDQLRQSQKMEALGQLTGGIAHDFNNLLTVVVGGLDLISRQLTDERMLRYARNALAAAERGARLTGQLLAFSRVQRLEVKPTLIGPLIDDMRPILRNALGPGIKQHFALDEELVPVMADPTQVEVALLNLAINARDAMPAGGTLTIGTEVVDVGDDDLELEPGAYVELSISDTGSGMPPEVVSRAFEPFFTTKDVGKGTGLGLSMVYGMARQSGGTARIDSAPGSGTTVKLYFRRAEAEQVALPDRAEGSERPTERTDLAISVLVIDDDPDVREFVAASLDEAPGFSVRSAADGRAGLAAFAADAPDVIVLDFVMPGMTGAEVAAKVLAERPAQPILFVSGYSETDAIRAIAPDAPVLTKPFRPEMLLAAIRALVRNA